MTEEQLAVARRLVACEQFEWRAGMQMHYNLNTGGYAPVRIIQVEGGWLYVRGGEDRHRATDGDLNIADYATAAILLRDALEAEALETVSCIDEWVLDWPSSGPIPAQADEDLGSAAALALLAIWEP